MKYIPPLGSLDSNAPYTDPVEGTIPARAVEQPMREIASVIASMGIMPSETDLTQLDQAIDMKVAAMQPDLSAFVGTERNIATTAPLTGGGRMAADLTLGITAAAAATPHHVVLRDAHGRAQMETPLADADVATKRYVDSADQNLDAALRAYVVGNGRIRQNSDLTVYISQDGDDAYDGQEDLAHRTFATFNGVRRVMRTLDMQGHTLYVLFIPETHSQPIHLSSGDACGADTLVLESLNPGMPVLLDTSDAYGLHLRYYGAQVIARDLRFRAQEACILVDQSRLTLAGTIICEGNSDGCHITNKSCVHLDTSCVLTLAGQGRYGLMVGGGSSLSIPTDAGLDYNRPTFSEAGVYCSENSMVTVQGPILGKATGRRFIACLGGRIFTNGQGPNVLPGTVDGHVETATYSSYS